MDAPFRTAPVTVPRRAQVGRVQRARPLRSPRSRVVRLALQAVAIVWHPGATPASRFIHRTSLCEDALGRPRQAAKRVSDGRAVLVLRARMSVVAHSLSHTRPKGDSYDPRPLSQQGHALRTGVTLRTAKSRCLHRPGFASACATSVHAGGRRARARATWDTSPGGQRVLSPTARSGRA